jgi:hypothetical protein
MKTRTVLYWASTAVIASSLGTGGITSLSHADSAVAGITALGYPSYFVTLLGLWKVFAVVALLAPRFPRLKEWAYAGIAFDLTGAVFSHLAVGDPMPQVLVPLVLLGIAATSWLLRPPSRRLGSATRAPTPSSTDHGVVDATS